MARFDYRGALTAYVEAREVAQRSSDWLDLGAIDLNLSSVYEQVWDLGAALRAVEDGRLAAEKARDVYYESQLLLQLGRLHAERRDQDPTPFYVAGIKAAIAGKSAGLEAKGWSLLGARSLSLGDLDRAEESFFRAYYLSHLAQSEEGLSFVDLGGLRLAQAEAASERPLRSKYLDEADRFTSLAEDQDKRRALNLVSFELKQQRGRILLLRGDTSHALEQLSEAVRLAEEWRGGMATGELQEQVFRQFVEAAANYGIRTGNPDWIAASFLAEEGLRASNLRDNRGMVDAWRRKLPDDFFTTLAELRVEQGRLRRAGLNESPESSQLQLRLIALESEAGLGLRSENNPENFSGQPSLNQYRSVLSNTAVLLSFALGDSQSFLWAVTRDSLNVYRLPPSEQIARAVGDFRRAIQEGSPEGKYLAKQLYAMLFSQLRPEETRKRDWLISPADALLHLPFAALVSGDAHYLPELHSLQIVSGAAFSAEPASEQMGPFLAVGDPIYNMADSRWQSSRGWFTRPTDAEGSQLNRLPGSRREIESGAKFWARPVVLEGSTARKDRFLEQLDPARHAVPAAIHLATHVLNSGGTNEAFIAFGLGADGQPELLGTSEIALLHVPGSLVLMTGCDSAGGDLHGAAGIENLTRAWMLAGAGAVVATQWPVKDSANEFLAEFYMRLRKDSPAEALQKAQIASIYSGTAAANPSAWASFEVYGGLR
jgi:CHAT domain-containing protein